MKSNKKSKILITCGLLFMILNIISTYNIFSGSLSTERINMDDNEYINLKSPKNSGFWNVNFIHINGNWTTARTNLNWVQGGNGSWNDPYIIENVTIDALGSGCGILIENSSDYFIIRNCTISNGSIGIKIEKAKNAKITNNKIKNFNGLNGTDGDFDVNGGNGTESI